MTIHIIMNGIDCACKFLVYNMKRNDLASLKYLLASLFLSEFQIGVV